LIGLRQTGDPLRREVAQLLLLDGVLSLNVARVAVNWADEGALRRFLLEYKTPINQAFVTKFPTPSERTAAARRAMAAPTRKPRNLDEPLDGDKTHELEEDSTEESASQD